VGFVVPWLVGITSEACLSDWIPVGGLFTLDTVLSGGIPSLGTWLLPLIVTTTVSGQGVALLIVLDRLDCRHRKQQSAN
jgi:hypothetical protein